MGGRSGLITDNFKIIIMHLFARGSTGTALYLLADVRYNIFSD